MNDIFTLCGTAVLPEGLAERTVVTVSGGKITAIADRASFQGTIDLDVGSAYIGPGFIDIHVHGGDGGDFMSGAPDDVRRVLQFHLRHGTTGILPTTTTDSHERTAAAVAAIGAVMEEQRRAADGDPANRLPPAGAQIGGVHLEGPFIHPRRKGGQNPAWIREPSLDEYKAWEKLAPIRMITLAPEVPGARALVEYAAASNVLVSAGHSDASLDEMERAVEWGVSHVTHFFNGMRELHHREPGVVGAGLLNPALTLELIADTIHVHPYLLRTVPRVKGFRSVALITDAVAFCGMPEGAYKKRGGTYTVKDGAVRMPDGNLAGSMLTMNRAVRNMVDLGWPVAEAWAMASEVPARLIRASDRKGVLKVGMDADLVALDSQFDVVFTMIAGAICR